MSEQDKIELFNRMKYNGGCITLTIVNRVTGIDVEKEYDHYEQCLADITGFEVENEVYF